MIKTWKHKGLKLFFETGNTKGIPADQAKKIRVRLDAINAATDVKQLDLPGWNLHELAGDRKGTWSIKVTGNWRITFRFNQGNAFDVNLEDYH
jgi:proteic killer suppression protein